MSKEIPQNEVHLPDNELREKAAQFFEDFKRVIKLVPDFKNSLSDSYWEGGQADDPVLFKRGNIEWTVMFLNNPNCKDLFINKKIQTEHGLINETVRVFLKEEGIWLKSKPKIMYHNYGYKENESKPNSFTNTQGAIDKANETLIAFENSTPDHKIYH